MLLCQGITLASFAKVQPKICGCCTSFHFPSDRAEISKLSFNIKALESYSASASLQTLWHHTMNNNMDNTTGNIWPPTNPGKLPGLSDFAKQQLEMCITLNKPNTNAEAVDLNNFMNISNSFAIKFGAENCRVRMQPHTRRQLIRKQIASAYPIIHEYTLFLLLNFLEHKKKFGNIVELDIYKNLTLIELVDRLLSKRCVSFFGSSDAYMLLNGTNGNGGFEKIGTADEKAPLLLKDVISYDEMKLAALLSVSTHSEFINDGSRTNAGRVEQNKSRIESDGVVMGLVGGRFERDNVMECQDILITREQNTLERGYGATENTKGNRMQDYRRVWREFYEEPEDFLFKDIKADINVNTKRFDVLGDNTFFDKVVMSKRYAISLDMMLLEAEARAIEAGKPAFIHVVGFGLGVWQVAMAQEEIFLSTLEQRLRALSDRLTHIGIVHLAWFHLQKFGGLYDEACIKEPKHPQGGIRVRFSKRNPADKLDVDMLPFVTYAWDGNALPGNEFWEGMLTASGDPAAACSTLIAELQNPHINKEYVNSNNLHIASMQHGILHISDYAGKLIG